MEGEGEVEGSNSRMGEQYKWEPNLGFDHKENKMLFFKIKSLLGPDGMPDGILYYTMNDIDLSLKISDIPTSTFYSCLQNDSSDQYFF